MIVNPDVVDV